MSAPAITAPAPAAPPVLSFVKKFKAKGAADEASHGAVATLRMAANPRSKIDHPAMSTTSLQICVEALSLPHRARAELAHRLLVSLEDEPVKPEVEEAWKEVAEQRFENLKKGRTTARDAKQAVRDARKRLAR